MPERPSEDILLEITRLLQSREKIKAIKVYRTATGCSLREAKLAVEAIQDGSSDVDLNSLNPGDGPGASAAGDADTPTVRSRGGCASTLLAFVIVGTLVFWSSIL